MILGNQTCLHRASEWHLHFLAKHASDDIKSDNPSLRPPSEVNSWKAAGPQQCQAEGSAVSLVKSQVFYWLFKSTWIWLPQDEEKPYQM